MRVPETFGAERPAREPKPATPSELIKANLEHRAKAALAPDELPRRKREVGYVHSARAPPPLAERLLSKAEVLEIVRVSYPTVWAMMRRGQFPRSRIVGGKSMWLTSEVNTWVARLPVRPLKGDAR
jgi:predicted DNA-binding transcriptional regulator AlpA